MITIEEIILVTREQQIGLTPIFDFLTSKINPKSLTEFFININYIGERLTQNSVIYNFNLISSDKTFCLRIIKNRQARFLVKLFDDKIKNEMFISYNLEFVTFCTDNKIDLICDDSLLNIICPKPFLRKRKMEKLNLLD